jgi:cytochrome o ubiquinol oxidase operon protein cyoD
MSKLHPASTETVMTAPPVISRHDPSSATMRSYVIGFVTSVCMTLIAYLLVVHRSFSSNAVLIAAFVVLALIQFIVQLIFFLHLGRETKPRWKLLVFVFMLVVVGILVGGSLWIMNNLNANMKMTPAQENRYMNDQDGL